MEYLPNTSILCLPYDEFVPAIVTKSNYDQLKLRGNITVHGRGGNGGGVLIEFETMPPKYRLLVKAKYGDPYEYHAKQPLLRMIKDDMSARAFYGSYMLEDGSSLSAAHQIRYTRQAEWLNMIDLVIGDKRALKRELKISIEAFWDNVISLAKNDKIDNDLPGSRRRMEDKLKVYRAEGYAGLITRRLGNQNTRKVNPLIERLILSLYLQETKPYHVDVVRAYERFMDGSSKVVDFETAEVFNREDFYVNGEPYVMSESTVYKYINTPLSRAVVDKIRMSDLQYAVKHRPFMQRLAPVYSFSKLTMDDTSSPFKQHNGVRPATYKAFDVASGALVAMVMHRAARPDVELIRKLIEEMFGLIVRKGWRMPAEIEVERALMSGMAGGVDEDGAVQNDVLTVGAVFQFVHFCAPQNPQEKRAEGFIKALKYGYQKHREGFQHRPFARLEANRMNADSDSHKRRFEFDEILAMELEDMELYNNALHPDQKKYPGLTRWQVLEQCQNPTLLLPNLPMIMPYIGRKTPTSYSRGFVQVDYKDYRLEQISHMANLTRNSLAAYWLPNESGDAEDVYLYQDGAFICKATPVDKYQDAKAERTDEDLRKMGRQMNYRNEFDQMVDGKLSTLAAVGMVKSETADKYTEIAQKAPVYAQGYDREDHAADDWSDAELGTEPEGVKVKKAPKKGTQKPRKIQKDSAKEGGYTHNEEGFTNPWLNLDAIAARAQSTI